jgi:methionine-gamma-lyase
MRKRHHSMGNRELNPETLALGYGYDPFLSEGAVKPPVFLTSTFQFRSAEDGKRFFEQAYRLRPLREDEEVGLIYSRLNNPNLQIFEERMAAWDQTEKGAAFCSGMAAISTSALAVLRPGDVLLATSPLYGGTHYLFHHLLHEYGIECHFAQAGNDAPDEMRQLARKLGPERVRMLFVETPANPSNVHTDIRAVANLAAELRGATGKPVVTAIDNTFLGPVFQRPATHGADLVIYSATKFIGGHSDLVAGVATGSAALLDRVLDWRSILGTSTTPFNGWLLLRSLETVSVRMRRQAKNARGLAALLHEHPRVTRVHYPTLLPPNDPQAELFQRQCTGPGALISFEVAGGEAEVFKILNRFEVFRLAVSLGGTESLVEHPMSMTHADVPHADLEAHGVSEGLIRISVGLEHLADLKRDLLWALT